MSRRFKTRSLAEDPGARRIWKTLQQERSADFSIPKAFGSDLKTSLVSTPWTLWSAKWLCQILLEEGMGRQETVSVPKLLIGFWEDAPQFSIMMLNIPVCYFIYFWDSFELFFSCLGHFIWSPWTYCPWYFSRSIPYPVQVLERYLCTIRRMRLDGTITQSQHQLFNAFKPFDKDQCFSTFVVRGTVPSILKSLC